MKEVLLREGCLVIALAAAVQTALAYGGAAKCGWTDAPYHRYEAESARLAGGAAVKGPSLDQRKIESQASDSRYVELPSKGASVEWVVRDAGCDGVTVRFTLPDRADGWRQDDINAELPQYRREDVFTDTLSVSVNGGPRRISQYGKVADSVPISSYWMWQYFTGDRPSDEPYDGYEFARFAFDEVHFRIEGAKLRKGDRLRIAKADGNNPCGIDFVEMEEVPPPIARPEGSLSVADYGSGREAIDKCFADCRAQAKTMYIPAGVWEYYAKTGDNRWLLSGASGMKITGAGVWHTNLHFPASKPFGGGVGGDRNAKDLEFCNLYMSSMLRSRCNQNAVYKGVMEAWGDGARIHDLWIEHFECGMWFGDYQGPAKPTVNARIWNCRLRNNLADGINLCQGTSSTTIEKCSFRGNGDDGIAIWNNDACGAVDAKDDVFRSNTVECNWRAGGIAIFGGDGHVIENNLVKDCYKGAGIRLNTDFPGYGFRNTHQILFRGNRIENCGTSWDCYGAEHLNRPSERGAVDIQGDVRNVKFEGTEIVGAHRCAIQLREQREGACTFTDTTVDGIGLDGGNASRYTHAADVGPGRVIFLSGSVKPVFDGLVVRNVKRELLLNELSSDGRGLVFSKPPEFTK